MWYFGSAESLSWIRLGTTGSTGSAEGLLLFLPALSSSVDEIFLDLLPFSFEVLPAPPLEDLESFSRLTSFSFLPEIYPTLTELFHLKSWELIVRK